MGDVTVLQAKSYKLHAEQWFADKVANAALPGDKFFFQCLLLALAQWLYGRFYMYGIYKQNDTYYVTSKSVSNLKYVGRLCKSAVDCRNLLCHHNGSSEAYNALDSLYAQWAQIMSLCKLFQLLPATKVERLNILCLKSGTRLPAEHIASLIPEASWNDIESLLRSFRRAITQ